MCIKIYNLTFSIIVNLGYISYNKMKYYTLCINLEFSVQ